MEDDTFALSPDVLAEMINSKSLAEFHALGGLHGIALGLRTDCFAGLSREETSAQDVVQGDTASYPTSRSLSGQKPNGHRSAVFGANRLPERKTRNILQLMWLAFNDKVLILLSVVATISLALGLYQSLGQPHAPGQPRVEWVDGVTIMTAVIIVVVVGALNDYQKEQQFARLTKKVSGVMF
jgi:P-type Ca2+ transporter type 2C